MQPFLTELNDKLCALNDVNSVYGGIQILFLYTVSAVYMQIVLKV